MDIAELAARVQRTLGRPGAAPAVLLAVNPADPARLGDLLRPGDVVARRGGGAVVLCDRLDATDDARLIAARIEKLLSPVDGVAARVWLRSVSGEDAPAALGELDADGRPVDASTGWLPLDAAARRAAQVRVPDPGELDLEYQPVVELRSGRVIGVEALLRVRDGDGAIPPNQFVPLAEASGAIVEIGAWAMRRACEQAGEWRGDPMLSDLRVGVNVSARQLDQPDFGERVADALAAGSSPLDPELLWVELTESLVLDDLDAAVPVLDRLRARGVRVALDDFGTGYSSLTHLRRLPIDVIKLDRSFVAHMDTDRRDLAIVRSSIGLAAALGLRCVAEGVSSSGHVEQLIEMGCDYGQGSWYSLPVPAERVPTVAREIARNPGR